VHCYGDCHKNTVTHSYNNQDTKSDIHTDNYAVIHGYKYTKPDTIFLADNDPDFDKDRHNDIYDYTDRLLNPDPEFNLFRDGFIHTVAFIYPDFNSNCNRHSIYIPHAYLHMHTYIYSFCKPYCYRNVDINIFTFRHTNCDTNRDKDLFADIYSHTYPY
jgi:hypothetical protein